MEYLKNDNKTCILNKYSVPRFKLNIFSEMPNITKQELYIYI